MRNRIHRRDAERAAIGRRLIGHARALRYLYILCVSAMMPCFCSMYALAQQLSREQWGTPPVTVSHEGDTWTIGGKKTQ